MKKRMAIVFSVLLLLAVLVVNAAATFTYEHDPTLNPKAMEDIVINPDAVYGFSPNPASKRLGVFADALDWTDPVQVAQAREARALYHENNKELYLIIQNGLNNGDSLETIARRVSQRRNEIRLESYKGNPEGLALVKQSNLETYGNELGPTPEYLYEKCGSWQTVIEKACSTNAGMDACLGFYDEYYYSYGIVEPVTPPEPAQPQTPAAPEKADEAAQPVTAQVTQAHHETAPEAGSERTSPLISTPPTGDSTIWLILPAAAVFTAAVSVAGRRKAKGE